MTNDPVEEFLAEVEKHNSNALLQEIYGVSTTDKLLALVRVYREANAVIMSPDFSGIQGMVIADMGLKHFTQHTAKRAEDKAKEIVINPSQENSVIR